MSKLKHLFISADQKDYPRWDEAFPKSLKIKFGDNLKEPSVDIVWMKIDNLENVKPQIEWLKRNFNSRFVILSSIPTPTEALEAISSGAKAYVNANAGPKTFKQISDVIIDGGIWLGEDLMQVLVMSLAKGKSLTSDNNDWQSKLTEREIEVAISVSKGATNKMIARQLNITERTVKAHMSAIFDKLGVKDRLKLALVVNNNG